MHRGPAATVPTWSRREVLGTLAWSAGIGWNGSPASAQVKWSLGTESPALKAPPRATDCHHHIYDARYPADPTAKLRPGDASVDDYRALQARIRTTRNVIVQPSTYGLDNRCALDALAAFGSTARAVVVVDDSVSTGELKRMDALGVRGIRFNLAQAGATTADMIEPLARRLGDFGWHVQINAPAERILELMAILERLPVPVVFDHLAHVPQPEGVNHPLFAAIVKLLQTGRAWVKLSGAYADTRIGPPSYADATAVARAYVAAAPDRLVWGSDWPHPTEQARTLPDDARLFDLLLEWAPDERMRQRILVDNPAKLYRF